MEKSKIEIDQSDREEVKGREWRKKKIYMRYIYWDMRVNTTLLTSTALLFVIGRFCYIIRAEMVVCPALISHSLHSLNI